MTISQNAIDKFVKRVESLNINSDNVKEVVLQFENEKIIIPNKPGKSMSLKIFLAVVNQDGLIKQNEAQKALNIFGEDFRRDSRNNIGKHPNIEIMEQIANGNNFAKLEIIFI